MASRGMFRRGRQRPASMLHDDGWMSAPFSSAPQRVSKVEGPDLEREMCV
jgi:hypothetical protein